MDVWYDIEANVRSMVVFVSVACLYESREWFYVGKVADGGEGWNRDVTLCKMVSEREARELADRFDGYPVYFDREKQRLPL